MALEGLNEEQVTRLATFAQSVLSNPDTKLEALRLAKKINPKFSNPELDTDTRIQAVREESAAALKKIQEERDADRIANAREAKTRELKEKGYDIVAVEKVMSDNGIGNYETAIKFMRGEAALAPAVPTSVTGGDATMPTGFKDIIKNPARWAREKAAEILNDARQGKPV